MQLNGERCLDKAEGIGSNPIVAIMLVSPTFSATVGVEPTTIVSKTRIFL